MDKIKTLAAYVNLISEVVQLGVALVILEVLISFAKNFNTLLDLAGKI